jgi:excisionase family DNA binding protein
MLNTQMEIKTADDFESQLKKIVAASINDSLNQYFDGSNQQEHKEWLSLGETADYLGISRNTLRKFIMDGLKITMVDKVTRVKRSDADNYMLQHQI